MTPSIIASDIVSVNKSDVTVYNPPLVGLWIGTAGTIVFTTDAGTKVTRTVSAETTIPCKVKMVHAETTASNIQGYKF